MRECAICIATGGPELRHDLHSEAGRRLLQLEAELRTLFTTLGAVDFKTYSQFMTNSVLPVQQSQQSVESALKQLNWLKLAVSPNDMLCTVCEVLDYSTHTQYMSRPKSYAPAA